jgi:hypothetical protein
MRMAAVGLVSGGEARSDCGLISDVEEGQLALALAVYSSGDGASLHDTGSSSTPFLQHDPLPIASFFTAHQHPYRSSRTFIRGPLPPCAERAIRCEVAGSYCVC